MTPRRCGWLALILLSACTANSAKSRYVLAEKLWADGNYPAAVAEFERATAKDPRGKIGLQALLRAAMTQAFYLSQYEEAIRKFGLYAELSGDTPSAWEARKQMGDIYFTKLERYPEAIAHYRAMLTAKPGSPEVPELLFRVGKSYFFLYQFDEALKTFEAIKRSFAKSPWAEKASYELGVTIFTRGGTSPGRRAEESPYEQAISAYRAFISEYPSSSLVPQAKFGIGLCLEELDQLDAAMRQYQEIEETYPAPEVIRLKRSRIKERQIQKGRGGAGNRNS